MTDELDATDNQFSDMTDEELRDMRDKAQSIIFSVTDELFQRHRETFEMEARPKGPPEPSEGRSGSQGAVGPLGNSSRCSHT